MTEPPYPCLISNNALDYQFDSVSSTKIVHKVIEFRAFTENPIFYNLALLDVEENGVNDSVISDNQDMNRVMATVFQAMLTFFEKHSNKLVYVKGSDERGVRTRLYRILIARELEQATQLFEIYGQLSGNSYEKFASNRPYIGFIFQLKR